MKAVAFPQANVLQKAPPGYETEVYDLSVWRGESDGMPRCISCWEPSPEERALIAAGGPVWLWVVGATHPPLVLDAASPFEPAPPARPTVAEFFRELLDRQKLTPEEDGTVQRARKTAAREAAQGGPGGKVEMLLAIIDRLTGSGLPRPVVIPPERDEDFAP